MGPAWRATYRDAPTGVNDRGLAWRPMTADYVAAMVADAYRDLFGDGRDVPFPGPEAAARIGAAEAAVRPLVPVDSWRAYATSPDAGRRGRRAANGNAGGTSRRRRRQLQRLVG